MSDTTPRRILEKGKAYSGLTLPPEFYFTPDSFRDVPEAVAARRRKECAEREAMGPPPELVRMMANVVSRP